MSPGLRAAAAALLLWVAPVAGATPPLQPLVDAVQAGGVLSPPAGHYAGPVVIRRPLVLELPGKTLAFSTPAEFEFGLASRIEFPVRKAARQPMQHDAGGSPMTMDMRHS